jgi:anti-sigma-K factor RskA
MADDAAMTPPPSLRSNVLAGIRTVRPLPPELPVHAEVPRDDTVVTLRRRPGRLRLVLAAAAAVVVAAVGVGVVTHPWTQETTQLSAADRVLAAPDAKHVSLEFDDGSKATVVRSVKEGRAVLVTQDMAAPPSGKVYELWLEDSAGSMEPAGLMSGSGDHKVLLRGNASDKVGVGITVEPDGGSPEPTSKPIALFDFSTASA